MPVARNAAPLVGRTPLGVAEGRRNQSKIGAAMKTELYVPVSTPIIIANAKACTPSPPKKNKIAVTKNTVVEVKIVRDSV